MQRSPVLVALAAISVWFPATHAHAQYALGFSWNRLADFTLRPAADANTTNGNPDDDSTGRPCWQYEYFNDFQGVGGPFGSDSPWYTRSSVLLVWDPSWFNTNIGMWVSADDRSPPIASNFLLHNIGVLFGDNLGKYPPLVRWTYPGNSGQCPIEIRINGTLGLEWSGVDVSLNTGEVDIAILRRHADGSLEMVFSGTYPRPVGGTALDIPIDVPVSGIVAGDAILFTHRSRVWRGQSWNYLYDDRVSLSVNSLTSVVRSHPVSRLACPGNDASFSVVGAGTGPFTYQWRKDNVAINPLSNPTAVTANLNIPAADTDDIGAYDCIVSSSCGTSPSRSANLTICFADFNCDATVDFFDYLDFVSEFAASSAAADFNRDEVVDFFDYLDFVQAFSVGC